MSEDLSNYQYLNNEKNINQIKVSDRIILLGYIDKNTFKKLSKHHKLGKFMYYRIDWFVFQKHLTCISTKISSTKKKVDNKYPLIERKKRTNIYTEEDWTKFGDNIIKQYFINNPIENWDIDWNDLDNEPNLK